MDWTTERKAFHYMSIQQGLTAGQVALGYTLLMMAEIDGAADGWFVAANKAIQAATGLSRMGILKARNVLIELGWLEVRSNGTRAAAYRICGKGQRRSAQSSAALEQSVAPSAARQRVQPQQQLRTCQAMVEQHCEKQPAVQQAWQDFLSMRLEQGKVPTQRAMELLLEKLERLAAKDSEKACQILHRSIMNGWAEVYELPPDFRLNHQRTGKTERHEPEMMRKKRDFSHLEM